LKTEKNMSEEKKKDGTLDQNKMEDVKGGIPYEDPGLIALGEVVVVPGEPGDPGDPGDVTTTGTGGCYPGIGNIKGGCGPGQNNTGQDGSSCGDGSGNNAYGPCAAGQGVLLP
jgi:hypothetical protein